MSDHASIGREINGALVKPKRQLAMVLDLNKCLGCHTCSIACKTQWTNREGMDGQWWSVVNTMPGQGTPKGWEQMGGGFESDGRARAGIIPIRQEHGDAWRFNHGQVMFEGGGKTSHLHPMTFDDKVTDYFARQQVLERLASADLPVGIQPQLAHPRVTTSRT